jgi:hypothetical protein
VITNPNRWPMTLGSELDWGFVADPNPHLNGRAIGYSMGKLLGGGSSINVSTWSRGHRADWDFYASESRMATPDPSLKRSGPRGASPRGTALHRRRGDLPGETPICKGREARPIPGTLVVPAPPSVSPTAVLISSGKLIVGTRRGSPRITLHGKLGPHATIGERRH